ncbi:MAG: hypothetical protein QXL94_03775 [Candidatus Parvarchaeum sp.]
MRYMVKVSDDRWDYYRELDEKGRIKEIHAVRRLMISKYLPIKFFTAGVLMILFGVIILSLYFITKYTDITYISSICFSAGVGLTIGSLFKAHNERVNEFYKTNECVRFQCYSWLLGVYVQMGSIVRTDEQKKLDQRELEHICNVLSLSLDLSKLIDLVDRYEFIRARLGNECYKLDFFDAGFRAMEMIYTRSENIRKMIAVLDEKERSEFAEKDLIARRTVENLHFFNNPVINDEYLNTLLKEIDEGFGLNKAISVKVLFENWYNNNLTGNN